MNPQQASIDAAIRYLASRKALPKLATPCPVLGRDVVLYKPAIIKP